MKSSPPQNYVFVMQIGKIRRRIYSLPVGKCVPDGKTTSSSLYWLLWVSMYVGVCASINIQSHMFIGITLWSIQHYK